MTDVENVYCAVRTESFNLIKISFSLLAEFFLEYDMASHKSYKENKNTFYTQ